MARVLVALAVVLLSAAVGRAQISTDLYYRKPPLFHLDDYERCLFHGGTYCMGDFQIWTDGPNQLYDELVEVSLDRYLPNRTLHHRGMCLSSCADGDEHEPAALFERCLDQELSTQYGLRAKLQHFRYCRNKPEPRPIDYTDLLVAGAIVIVILLNAIGTVYDLTRNPDEKPHRLLLAWSLCANWRKLTTCHSGDPRLDALSPIHGLKVHQTILVIMAHTMMAFFVLYFDDTRLFDQHINSFSSVIFRNGTVIVPTFATLTAFLFAYMTLLYFEKTKTKSSFMQMPKIILYRYLKMTPTAFFVVAVTATWVARLQDGPMWTFVEELETACRAKWWTHLLYVNNFVNLDQKCLIQSWFMAVDMQMFVPLVALTLYLARQPERAPRVLVPLYVAVLAALLAFNVQWGIEPMNNLVTLEGCRTMYVGNKSYSLMYVAPWTNAIPCLHGVFVAFIYYNYQKRGSWDPAQHKWIHGAAYFVYPMIVAGLYAGVPMRYVTNPLYLSLFATFVIPVFNIVVAFSMWCFLHKLGGRIVNEYLSWRGFQVLGRMSLCTLLVHWHINLGPLAAQTRPIHFTIYNFFSNWFTGLIMTVIFAMPLHLMVELPTQKMIDLML